MEGIYISITSVNPPSKELSFFIDGLSHQMVLGESLTNDPGTTCYLSMDLFMGACETDRHAHRELALTVGLVNIRD